MIYNIWPWCGPIIAGYKRGFTVVHNLFSYPNHFMVTVNPSSNQFMVDAYQLRVVCPILDIYEAQEMLYIRS